MIWKGKTINALTIWKGISKYNMMDIYELHDVIEKVNKLSEEELLGLLLFSTYAEDMVKDFFCS